LVAMGWQVYITDEDYAIAAKNGITKNAVWQRVYNSNWSKEDAITKPLLKRRNHRQWEVVCKQNGIRWNTFLQRVNTYGWKPEKAATTPTRTKHEVMEEARKANPSILTERHLELMKKNGLCKGTVFSRKFRGWTIERAVSTPPMNVGNGAKMKKSV
jgi:hypothetical protein